jgi:divalent metal cation (Fe/Co/Zn/Cd) transporter
VHVEPRRRGLDLRDRVLAIALAEPLVMEAHDITIFEQDGSASVSLHLKFPADLDLCAAHEIAERIERAICARPGVGVAQTHLEPLEQRLAARPVDDDGNLHAMREIERLVRARTGVVWSPQKAKLLSTDAGRVLFLTLGVDPGESLVDAHRLAGELEEELRQQIPDIADVVIHTEPAEVLD